MNSKNIIFFLVLIGVGYTSTAQQTGLLVLDDYQRIETSQSASTYEIQLPAEDVLALMGGLNDWDGMNNYFNIFGSKLIVERIDIKRDGSKHLTLRREDGRNFYDLFPTITAKLVPIEAKGQLENL